MVNLLLPFIVLILFMLIFFYMRREDEEHFQVKDIKIVQKKNKNFALDEYSLNDGSKSIEIKGEWNFDKKEIYLVDNKKKIPIKKNKNVYEFVDSHGHDIQFKYNGSCGDIIINNHSDDLTVCHKDGEYIFKRKDTEIAKIFNNNDTTYKINVKEKSVEKYIKIFFVVFVVFNQIQKELTISLDSII